MSKKNRPLNMSDLNVTEHGEQCAFIDWARNHTLLYPELDLLFAIPNGGYRNKITACKLQAEGVKRGVPDLMCACPRRGKHGLFIEMKVGRNKPTEEQARMIEALRNQNYLVEVCYSFEAARDLILWYLGVTERVEAQ